MAANKKPRKNHRCRIVRAPSLIQVVMVGAEMPLLATQLHAAIIYLTERPEIVSCNNLSKQLCVIAGGMSHANKGAPILDKRGADSIAIKSAIMAIESIVHRHDRTGVVAVRPEDASTLRAAAGKLDGVLSRIPISAYVRAQREVEDIIRMEANRNGAA